MTYKARIEALSDEMEPFSEVDDIFPSPETVAAWRRELDALLADLARVEAQTTTDRDVDRWAIVKEALQTAELRSPLARLAAISAIVNSRKPYTEAQIARTEELFPASAVSVPDGFEADRPITITGNRSLPSVLNGEDSGVSLAAPVRGAEPPALQVENARLKRELIAAKLDLAFHADCRPNRRQAEAWRDDAKATNDRWADEVAKNRALTEELETLRSRGVALQPPNWQPIETAPKDRPILLWQAAEKCATVGRWNDSYTTKWHACVHGDEAPWNDWDRAPIFEASHWMPLPVPPSAEAPHD